MASADRYYRVTGMDATKRASEAQQAAVAFKAVAAAWVDSEVAAARMAGLITYLDLLLLGGIWYASGDFTAPAVAALCYSWVDYSQLHAAVRGKEVPPPPRKSKKSDKS